MILRVHKILVFFTLVLSLFSLPVLSQNVLDDIEEEDILESGSSESAPSLVSETIKVISPSKKIFILTNENRTFSKGDFISLLLGNKLVCRALVAKTNDDQLSGIKIIKIYNVNLWKQLAPNKEVLVLKGDDSYYANLEKAPKDIEETIKKQNKVQDEDDLFNSTTLNDDDLSIEESNSRLIKTDNVISAGVGLIQGKNLEGQSKKYTHPNGSWSYQLADNLWGELGVGTNTIVDFPAVGLDTMVINFSTKLKFTFEAPFYSYLMPYVGYQVIQARSGADAPAETPEEDARELSLLNGVEKSSPIFGVTVLKRIVPGWFIRLDLGSDLLNAGLALEF